jgi:hypothetical protein
VTEPPSSQLERGQQTSQIEPTADAPGQIGQPDVDAALEELAKLENLPVAEHVDVYDDVHQRLAAAISDDPDRPPTTDPG